jgi:biopolymer transport protein ExbD
MRVRKQEEEPFEIMLIPMIDCMLVIIIFFLVATTLKNTERELPLELPESAAAIGVQQAPDTMVVGLDKEGRTFLGTDARVEPVDRNSLHQRIREAARANPAQRVRIDCDRDTRFEDFVHLVDLCQFEGLKNIGIHTRRDAPNPK